MSEQYQDATIIEGDKKLPFVVIGVPAHDGNMCMGGVNALLDASQSKDLNVGFQFLTGSFLTKGFNQLLCNVLNNRSTYGFTHFLLHHADIEIKTQGWLPKMVQLMDQHGADVLSAISPIKNESGLTSTALQMGDPYPIKRFTLHEVHAMKEKTFTHEKLLLNTGVMLIDVRKPWIDKAKFTIEDEILQTEKGMVARSLSEDWHFSRMAREMGAKLYATSEIQLNHWGVQAFPSYTAWGTMKEDKVSGTPNS